MKWMKSLNNNQNPENITVTKEVKDWTDIHEDFGKEWYRGKTYQQKWEQVNITYEQAKSWIEVGFTPYHLYYVEQWINCEFSPIETKSWLDQGFKKDEDWQFASWLRNNNQTITDNLEQLRTDYENLKTNNSQAWLEQVYPNQNVKELYIGKSLYSLSLDKLTGELNLSNYSQLEKLDCSGNKLTTITYPEQLEYLTELNISRNNFPQQAPTFLTKMPNLEVLNIGGGEYNKSNFTNLEAYLKYCPKLKVLSAYDSNLTGSLTIQDLPALEGVYLGRNYLTKLQLLNCPNLTEINCYSNKLTNLNFLKQLSNPVKITNLKLSYNYSLNQTLDCFTPLVNLEELYLENTKFHGSLAPLGANSKLKKLDINNTNLNSDLENLPVSLETISAKGMTNIKKKLEGFEKDSLGNYNYQPWRLGWEWLQDNNKLSPEQKQSITTLNISNSNLTGSLDFSELPNLTTLDCSNNQITHLNITQNLALTTLLANDNNLKEIEFPTDLNQFNLTRINITNNKDLNYLAIDKKFLKILPKLGLNLENNELQEKSSQVLALKETSEKEVQTDLTSQDLERTQQELQTVKNDNFAQEQQVQNLQNSLQVADKQINQLKEEITDLQEDKNQWKIEQKNLITVQTQLEKEKTELKEELRTEKRLKNALEKSQKELSGFLVQKAIIDERTKNKSAEMEKLKKELKVLGNSKSKEVDKNRELLREIQRELTSLERQKNEVEKGEKELQTRINLLRQSPITMRKKLEEKITEIKQKLKKDNEEQKWLDSVLEWHHRFSDPKSNEDDFRKAKSELEKLKTNLLTSRKIGGVNTVEIIKFIAKRSDDIVKLWEALRKLDKIEVKEQKAWEKLRILEQESGSESQEFNIELISNQENYGLCEVCEQPKTGLNYCQLCKSRYFQQNFKNWTSGKQEIDKLIQKYQQQAKNKHGVLEWIPYEQFKNVEYLAEGGFGKVYKAQWKGQKVALKILNNSQNITADFLHEITNHKFFSDKIHIVPCYGISQDSNGNYMMVIQYVESGDLRHYLQNNYRKLNFENKLFQLKTIAQGLKNIHQQGLIHRDFHSGNILVDNFENSVWCNITDLGLCRPVGETGKEKNVYGVLPYVAPEVLKNQPYTQAADIYSFGIIVYEVLTGLPPYHDWVHDTHLALKILEGLQPQFNIKVPHLLEDLIEQCWDSDPKKRPAADKLEEKIALWWSEVKEGKNTEFTQQIQESEKHNQTLPDKIKYPNYQLHPRASHHSKLISTKQITKLLEQPHSANVEFDINNLNLDELNLEEDPQEQSSTQAQIEIPPK